MIGAMRPMSGPPIANLLADYYPPWPAKKPPGRPHDRCIVLLVRTLLAQLDWTSESMGWLRQLGRDRHSTAALSGPLCFDPATLKATISHIEDVTPVELITDGTRLVSPGEEKPASKKRAQDKFTVSAEDSDAARSDLALGATTTLPCFSPEEVARHDNAVDGFWVVIDDKVYDVTKFIDIHPGGSSFFEDFGGKSCTWQFWRFHRANHLSMWSPSLLIGRTSGTVPNPYKEPPRWIKTS